MGDELSSGRDSCVSTLSAATSVNVTNAVKTPKTHVVGFAQDDRTFQLSGTLDSTLNLDLGSKDPVACPRCPGYSACFMAPSLPMSEAKGTPQTLAPTLWLFSVLFGP